MELNNEALRLENQICFPLYACAKEIVKRYRPFLEEIDLTYTQFITMIVLWENGSISAKEIGRKLFLDSGTLTPVLKSLANKGFITRERSKDDERVLMIDLTEKGRELQKEAFEEWLHPIYAGTAYQPADARDRQKQPRPPWNKSRQCEKPIRRQPLRQLRSLHEDILPHSYFQRFFDHRRTQLVVAHQSRQHHDQLQAVTRQLHTLQLRQTHY